MTFKLLTMAHGTNVKSSVPFYETISMDSNSHGQA